MSKMQQIIQDLKQELGNKYSQIIMLEGLFEDTSAGGVVWKSRKRKSRGKRKSKVGKEGGEIKKYAYYQYADKRKPKGKRKQQKYIRLADWEWVFKWIEKRRKQWEELKEARKSARSIIRALKALGEMRPENVIDEIRVKYEQMQKIMRKKKENSWKKVVFIER